MKDEISDLPNLPMQRCVNGSLAQFVIGRLMQSKKAGEILVACHGLDPRPARLLAGIDRGRLIKHAAHGQEVLVVFAHDNPDEPVIVGVMENILESMVAMEDGSAKVSADPGQVVIRAEKEVVLACGDSSISLTREGRVIVKGRNILSRASKSNKIKGPSVEIN